MLGGHTQAVLDAVGRRQGERNHGHLHGLGACAYDGQDTHVSQLPALENPVRLSAYVAADEDLP